jgi:hypothetical protein
MNPSAAKLTATTVTTVMAISSTPETISQAEKAFHIVKLLFVIVGTDVLAVKVIGSAALAKDTRRETLSSVQAKATELKNLSQQGVNPNWYGNIVTIATCKLPRFPKPFSTGEGEGIKYHALELKSKPVAHGRELLVLNQMDFSF